MASPAVQPLKGVSAPGNSYPSGAASRSAPSRWILGSGLDLLLFVSTPVLIVPVVLLLQGKWVGVEAETISLVVAAFGGFGHHLPGMIRAYGDRELFQRFRWRFILAPAFLLTVSVPLSLYRLNAMELIIALWAYWHALMQVYGFVRIYDVKVGSVAPSTAWWDWLMCVTWFAAGMVVSDGRTARLLNNWYSSGGPLIPPGWIQTFRWLSVAAAVAALVGFLINHAIQVRRGASPNPVKLLMLSSGIGFWWFAMVYVPNIVVGIALFEIFHDVQYLAIVWLYNCRRANATPKIGTFMKFVFRRSHAMLLLYIGLVFAYGVIGLAAVKLEGDLLKTVLTALLWTSTILHFYYDGFIWKVRESSTRAGLGLSAEQAAARRPAFATGELGHALKWSPVVLLIGWLSMTELSGSSLPAERTLKRSWPNSTELERVRNIAAAAPGDLNSQLKAARALHNLGRSEEAVRALKALLVRQPEYAEGHQTLGEIHHVNGALDHAAASYRLALRHASRKGDRLMAHHRLGEVYLLQQDAANAEVHFREALRIDPQFEGSLMALEQLTGRGSQPRP